METSAEQVRIPSPPTQEFFSPTVRDLFQSPFRMADSIANSMGGMTSSMNNITGGSSAGNAGNTGDIGNMATSVAAGNLTQAADEAQAAMNANVRNLPIVSHIADQVDNATNAMQRVGMRKADELVAASAGRMINSIGATMLSSLHDHAMPRGIHALVDNIYGSLWPEIKKSMMDAVMLGTSFEFQALRRRQVESIDPEAPRGPLKRLAARLLYAMEPYDLTFWGVLRSPLSALVQLLFYFPFYGISDTMVLTLAACKYFTDFNEYGLIKFIVSSKRLQFITSGLMSGTWAFTKLFVCATLREDKEDPNWEPSYFECETFSPGSHRTFIYEFTLFLLRSFLNWYFFAVLWNYKAVKANRLALQSLQAQQRLRGGAARRGLFPLLIQRAVLVLTWGLYVCNLALLSESANADADGVPGVEHLEPWLDVFVVATLLQLFTHRMLNVPCYRSLPARLGTFASLFSAIYLYLRLPLPAWSAEGMPLRIAFEDARRGEWSAVGSDLALAVSSSVEAVNSDVRILAVLFQLLTCVVLLCIHTSLLCLQFHAKRMDDAAVSRLEKLIQSAEVEQDGTLSKAEARQKYYLFVDMYKAVHPKKKSNLKGDKGTTKQEIEIEALKTFDQFWEEVDTNGDGRLDLNELKDYYGYRGKAEEEEEKQISYDDPNYIERRLEELHRQEFGKRQLRPGGALIYFVIWDISFFVLGCSFVIPFLYRETIDSGLSTLGEFLTDWRIRCGLYFLKVFVAILAFPFLVFALPLIQEWLTHVKASGYDTAANCVTKLSSSQIKAKFRYGYVTETKRRAARAAAMAATGRTNEGGYRGYYDAVHDCWDRFLGVDAEYEMRVDSEVEPLQPKSKKGQQKAMSVVEAAEQRRRNMARQDFGDEASLMVFEHYSGDSQRLKGQLILQGDPSSLLML